MHKMNAHFTNHLHLSFTAEVAYDMLSKEQVSILKVVKLKNAEKKMSDC